MEGGTGATALPLENLALPYPAFCPVYALALMNMLLRAQENYTEGKTIQASKMHHS